MKKLLIPALAAVFGLTLMAADPGDTAKGEKKDCAACCKDAKDCKDGKAKEAKAAKTPKAAAPKA
jgi:hypothetical protein